MVEYFNNNLLSYDDRGKPEIPLLSSNPKEIPEQGIWPECLGEDPSLTRIQGSMWPMKFYFKMIWHSYLIIFEIRTCGSIWRYILLCLRLGHADQYEASSVHQNTYKYLKSTLQKTMTIQIVYFYHYDLHLQYSGSHSLICRPQNFFKF